MDKNVAYSITHIVVMFSLWIGLLVLIHLAYQLNWWWYLLIAPLTFYMVGVIGDRILPKLTASIFGWICSKLKI